jgi:cellulose synthase operon protein C
MARKKKRRNRKSQAIPLGKQSPEALLEKGNLLLEQEKFQDALLYFKEILKKEESPEALAGLERAYFGRIGGLAAKSMAKEALAMLETLESRCADADTTTVKLDLFLQSGKYAEAARLYDSCHPQLTEGQRGRLEALFGALMLAGEEVAPNDLSVESPVVRYYAQARRAVELLCAKHYDDLSDALQRIPLRSPYRDLRILLTGMMHLQQDQESGREFLQKIAEDSPYFYTATATLSASDGPRTTLSKLAGMTTAQRRWFREQRGIPASSFKALEDLATSDMSAPRLLGIVRHHQKCFTREQRFWLLRNILPFAGIHAANFLESTREFSIQEMARILALAAEKDGAPSYAVQYWDNYLTSMDGEESASDLEVALIKRLQAQLMRQDYFEFSREEILKTMLDSLHYDPEHAQTWIDTADLAKPINQNQYYAILGDAAKRLPDNIQILLAMMKACGERKAFKKAAGLAKKVLEIDPINTTALDFLVEARLEHGRKLAGQQKWDLAEKEFWAAGGRVKSLRFRGRNLICLGMVLLLRKNEEGMHHIARGQEENGSKLPAHLLISLESRLFNLPKARQNSFDRNLRQAAEEMESVDSSEFLRIISWLSSFTGEQWAALTESCLCLKKYFSRCAGAEWSLQEGLEICKTLERADLLIPLLTCAAGLEKRYPDSPECKAWHIVAHCRKNNEKMSYTALDEFQDLLKELVVQRRFGFAEQMDNILESNDLYPSAFIYDEEDGEEDEFFDFEPFGPPSRGRINDKPKPPAKKPSPSRRQLNLFDNLLDEDL